MVKMLGFLFTNRYNVSHSEKYDDGVIMAVEDIILWLEGHYKQILRAY